ncbi:hypothetical protein CAPTEDRAFT_217854 [Capitella teleta]|uniref:Alpha-2-macroglobulin domain-containing protein n=1 Tax=Capitella teleta TaxID=283909 RepID=R7VGJ0_CAPTE|nr:hypothetical protein CAPTEDRAFT_217854 [Capitella teleta]|eukprot:ELU17714.1 hypothetical protein CAPTEDRAFT_217854 [Capitella teleta]
MASYTILQSVEIRGCIVNFQANCLDNKVTAYKSGIRKFKSPNDAGIQVTLRNSDEFIKRTDQHVTFDVHSTESISGFSYVLLSKGSIVYTDNHASSSPTTKHTIILPMTPEMAHKLAPSGRLNIWYLTSTGEIVTDSLELKVEGAFLNEANCLDNKVTAYKSGIRKFKSPNDAGIQVTLRNSDEFIKRTDQHVTFDVHSTESISGFSYVLLSKGSIVYTDNHASSSPTTKHTIILPMTPEMAHKLAPSGRLNIWYLTSTGEIVTDSLELKVEGAFLNEVELNFAEAEMRPRQINALNVQANPGSLIGVLAVDKRVLLLKQGNDLGKDEVVSDLKKYDSSLKPGGSPGGSDSSEIFESSGLIVFIDDPVEPVEEDESPSIRSFEWLIPIGVMFPRAPSSRLTPKSLKPSSIDDEILRTLREMQRAREVASTPPERVTELPRARTVSPDKPQRPLAQPALVRSHFPESWIWTELHLSDSGNATIECTVPDTITSWVATAFAMNRETGLGFSSPAEMTTFTPFFLSLNLPYSVIRGEEFALAVTVFNYLPTNQEGASNLKNQYCQICPHGNCCSASRGAGRDNTFTS